MEVFLERLLSSSVRRLIRNVRILLVTRATVVLGAMSLPVAKTHPAEIVLAAIALHMVAASIFLYTNLALGTHLKRNQLTFSNKFQD